MKNKYIKMNTLFYKTLFGAHHLKTHVFPGNLSNTKAEAEEDKHKPQANKNSIFNILISISVSTKICSKVDFLVFHSKQKFRSFSV